MILTGCDHKCWFILVKSLNLLPTILLFYWLTTITDFYKFSLILKAMKLKFYGLKAIKIFPFTTGNLPTFEHKKSSLTWKNVKLRALIANTAIVLVY